MLKNRFNPESHREKQFFFVSSNVIIKPLERRIREIKGVEHIYGAAMNNVGMVNVQYFIGENRINTCSKIKT